MSEQGFEIRYGTFSRAVRDQPWVACIEAEVLDGGALAIKWDDDNLEYVPLHVIRGPIQIRRKAPTEEAP